MKELFNPMILGLLIAAVTGLFAIFHILVIIGIVPDTVVWGGPVQRE